MDLRLYQSNAIKMIVDAYRFGYRRILLVMPTGSGKSHVLREIASGCVAKGHKVLSLVHMRNLVTQLSGHYEGAGVETGQIMAGVDHDTSLPCQVASMLTYNRRIKLSEKERNHFFIDPDVILIDEAQHSLGKSYQAILSNYSDKLIIGVTAAPSLSSGIGFGNFYETLIQPVMVNELIQDGFLVPGNYYGPSPGQLMELARLKLEALKSQRGDFKPNETDKIVNTPEIIGDVVLQYARIAQNKSAMVFAINRKHGKALNREFQKHGFTSEYLDAHSSDEVRDGALTKFRARELKIICQVGLYIEGTDIPEIEALIDCAPCRSLGRHIQKIGRAARPNPGKKSFIYIDHCGNVAGRNDSLGKYEQDIIWELDGKDIKYRVVKTKEEKEKPMLICEHCQTIFRGNRCPMCLSFVVDYGKKVEALHGDLIKIGNPTRKTKPKPTMAEKQAFYSMLEHYRRSKNYQRGWTAHQFRQKYQTWPRGLNETPSVPDENFLRYMKYQQIRSAKRREKERNSG